jgi:predicted Holliday junction resolvase-like endonuclease
MTKFISITAAVLVAAITILSFIIKSLRKKTKEQQTTINDLLKAIEQTEDDIKLIKNEIDIERRHNNELAKKLADVSSMSIDDVLHQLQQ